MFRSEERTILKTYNLNAARKRKKDESISEARRVRGNLGFQVLLTEPTLQRNGFAPPHFHLRSR